MPEAPTADTGSKIIDMRIDVVMRVALLGIGLGIVSWTVATLLGRFVIAPLNCIGAAPGVVCSGAEILAGNIALVLAAIAGVLGLVRLGVYRPMLVAIAVGICLWNLGGLISGLAWYEALAWTGLMYMVGYVAFSWLVRPRNFVLVLIMLLVVIFASRIVATL